MRRTVRRKGAILVVAAALVAALPPGLGATADNPGPANGPTAGEGAFRHLRALQEIAAASGGNRAAGSAGYDRSAEYVAERLREAGYNVRFEEFTFPFFEERAPPVLAIGDETARPTGDLAAADAVRTLSNSGSGHVTAPLRAVKLGLGEGAPGASTSGCDAADFTGFERGAVALIRRGTCTFQTKVENAVAAGAVGVIIMNEGTERRVEAFSGQRLRIFRLGIIFLLWRAAN